MINMKRAFIIIVLSLIWLLAACQKAPAQDAAAKSVETYLQAKVNRDANTIRRLLCAELEPQYDTEVTTFEGTSNAHIDGMVCARVGESNVVKCTGKIVADYGTEKNEFPLGSYRIKQEDGEWKWCGEAPTN